MDINFGVKKELWYDPENSNWSENKPGILQLDTDFNPSTRINQYRLLTICNELRKLERWTYVDCPIQYV